MKIEVGEYARTKDGKIVKIIGMDEILISYETEENPGYNDLYSEDIIKHSKDIIDLIEVRRLCKWLSSKKNSKF